MIIQDTLFDKIITVTFRNYTNTLELTEYNDTVTSQTATTHNKKRDVTITCPQHGPKPDISLSVTMLPGLLCHEMTLTIVNFSTDIDITEFQEAVITAGYSNRDGSPGQTFTFVCPIFSSYIESPNPNGRTVFKGVVVGSMQKILTPAKVKLVFNEVNVTLKELCSRVITALGLGVQFNWPDNISNLPLRVERKTYVGRSGYAVINWLANQLYQLSQAEGAPIPKDTPILFNWDGDTIYLGYTGYIENTQSLNIVDLTRVTAASVQGGTINVRAPWNPRVRPGSIFKMEARYFRGRMSPNVALPQLLSPTNLYSVIKLDLTFGTVDGNEMSLLAIPVRDNKGNAVQEVYESASQKASSVPQDEAELVISFGTATEDNNDGDVYQVNLNDPFSLPSYVVQAGDTLSGLATKWYGDIHYKKTEDSEGRRLLDIPPGGSMPAAGYTGSFFWPVIYFSTVKAMETDSSYYINRSNPNDLQIGKKIVQPPITDPDQLKNGAELFEKAANLWQQLNSQSMAFNDGGCVEDFRRIAYFMGVE